MREITFQKVLEESQYPTAKLGEVAINTYDGKVFIKKDDGVEQIVEIGPASAALITQNMNLLTADFTLATGYSGVVASGFEIDDGVTLTIPDGSTLVIV